MIAGGAKPGTDLLAALAQAGAPKPASVGTFLTVLGLMIAALVAAGLILLAYRRRVLANDDPTTDASLMQSLRDMRDRGEISREEFDAMRARMAAKLRDRTPPPRPEPSPSERRARPGFDLTGAPLPRRPDGDPPAHG